MGTKKLIKKTDTIFVDDEKSTEHERCTRLSQRQIYGQKSNFGKSAMDKESGRTKKEETIYCSKLGRVGFGKRFRSRPNRHNNGQL